MIIELFFIFTMLSGLTQEILTIIKSRSNLWTSAIYSLGAIFFLFWEEPYILKGGMLGLFILSIVHIIANKEKDKISNFIITIDPYLSLLCLVALVINYVIYFR